MPPHARGDAERRAARAPGSQVPGRARSAGTPSSTTSAPPSTGRRPPSGKNSWASMPGRRRFPHGAAPKAGGRAANARSCRRCTDSGRTRKCPSPAGSWRSGNSAGGSPRRRPASRGTTRMWSGCAMVLPADRLLVMEPGEGCERLWALLGAGVPDMPCPSGKRNEGFRRDVGLDGRRPSRRAPWRLPPPPLRSRRGPGPIRGCPCSDSSRSASRSSCSIRSAGCGGFPRCRRRGD